MKSLLSILCFVLIALFVSSCKQKDNFTTPDLTFFELKGHVHTVEFEYDTQTIVFTPEGILESWCGEYPYYEKGHYIGFCRGEKDLSNYFVTYYDITSTTDYRWSNGHVVHSTRKGEGACSETEFIYDDRSDLKSIRSERSDPMSTCVSTK